MQRRELVFFNFLKKKKITQPNENLIRQRYPLYEKFIYPEEGTNFDSCLFQLIQDAISKHKNPKSLYKNQHFYIEFKTSNSELPTKLKKKFPTNMAIVLECAFEIKEVTNDYFIVELYFNSSKQNIKIPYKEITVFSDPSCGMAFTR